MGGMLVGGRGMGGVWEEGDWSGYWRLFNHGRTFQGYVMRVKLLCDSEYALKTHACVFASILYLLLFLDVTVKFVYRTQRK